MRIPSRPAPHRERIMIIMSGKCAPDSQYSITPSPPLGAAMSPAPCQLDASRSGAANYRLIGSQGRGAGADDGRPLAWLRLRSTRELALKHKQTQIETRITSRLVSMGIWREHGRHDDTSAPCKKPSIKVIHFHFRLAATNWGPEQRKLKYKKAATGSAAVRYVNWAPIARNKSAAGIRGRRKTWPLS